MAKNLLTTRTLALEIAVDEHTPQYLRDVADGLELALTTAEIASIEDQLEQAGYLEPDDDDEQDTPRRLRRPGPTPLSIDTYDDAIGAVLLREIADSIDQAEAKQVSEEQDTDENLVARTRPRLRFRRLRLPQ